MAEGGSGGDSDAGAGGNGGEAGDDPPVDCNALAKPPAKFESLSGFTNSEDFAFDALGNYVGVDGDGNLVRVDKSGTKQLWASAVSSQTAGIQMLRDGSAIIADVTNGALLRVYPNGARKVVLGGLLYPNGLDIGPDGFVYVSENAAGRVRRIDPETGDFTIVALGLFGPNGVAFGDDPKLMYIGSFEGSGVYKVVLGEPGALGTASVFARPHGSQLPEPKLACPDQQVGKPCVGTMSGSGTCQKLANVVDCVTSDGSPDECDGKPDGTSCSNGGTCQFGYCTPPDPCDGKKAGDACTSFDQPGTCTEIFDGELACQVPDPCQGKDCPGDPGDDSPGGIDGLGVDACGNVYASEFTHGIVWRISPAGEVVRLVDLPSSWVPNIKWGRGLGGFERDRMFVADRDESRLFSVAVGVPGAREFYEGAKP